VEDRSAKIFGAIFYNAILLGHSLGEALIQSRARLHVERSPDWADYIHYGDSEFRIKLRSDNPT
jgi:hypothetical protein